MERYDLDRSDDRHDVSGSGGSTPCAADARSCSMTGETAARLMQRLSTITEILHGWIWETDAQHRFTYLSDSVTRFSGRPPEWHYGRTRAQLGNHTPDVSQHHAYLKILDAHETFGPIEFVRYQDGAQFWMRTIGRCSALTISCSP